MVFCAAYQWQALQPSVVGWYYCKLQPIAVFPNRSVGLFKFTPYSSSTIIHPTMGDVVTAAEKGFNLHSRATRVSFRWQHRTNEVGLRIFNFAS